jgi:hypothetical protein
VAMLSKWIRASAFVVGIASAAALQACGSGQNQTSVSPREPAEHRAKAPSCVLLSRSEPDDPRYGDCKKHADCTARPNGACVNTGGAGYAASSYYGCVYTCTRDTDCAKDELCECSEGGPGVCLRMGNCRIDADCGGGAASYCSRAYTSDCGGYHALSTYFCHTPRDTCIDDRDCTGDNYCDYDLVNDRWECTAPDMTCAIG